MVDEIAWKTSSPGSIGMLSPEGRSIWISRMCRKDLPSSVGGGTILWGMNKQKGWGRANPLPSTRCCQFSALWPPTELYHQFSWVSSLQKADCGIFQSLWNILIYVSYLHLHLGNPNIRALFHWRALPPSEACFSNSQLITCFVWDNGSILIASVTLDGK